MRARRPTPLRRRAALLWLALFAIAPAHACADEREPRSTHVVLVSQAGSTTLATVDPERAIVSKRIQVGQLPHRLLRDRAGTTVYAVLVGSQAIAELDAETLELRRTLLTAAVPSERPDGSRIEEHVSADAFGHSNCFDCHQPGGAKPLTVGERPVGIALSQDETQLFVSHIRRARLSVIDLGSGAIERSELLPPAGTAVEAADLVRLPGDSPSLVVSLRPVQPSSDPGVVRFLDEATLQPKAEFATGSDPAALLALPERGSVLVSNFDSNVVIELSLERAPRRFTVTPGPLGAVAFDDQRHALTLDYYSNGASWLDLTTGQVTQMALELDGAAFVNPTRAAISPDGEIAYVVSSGTDGHLLALDLRTRALRSAIAIDGLSFDAVVVPRGP